MRTIQVGFEVDVPDGVTDDQVLCVMTNLINVGLSDASDTAEDDDLEGGAGGKEEAEVAISLSIGPAELLPRPDSLGE